MSYTPLPSPLLFIVFFLGCIDPSHVFCPVSLLLYRHYWRNFQQRGRTGRSEVKEETEGRSGGGVGCGRKEAEEGVEGWRAGRAPSRSVRSGAAPPVIIRVTAARARLRAACTRRDVLPREKSEHLSVPPRRQQPPTSLSNSTQLVTRSPNSYFLSLARSRSRTYAHARQLSQLIFFFFFFLHTPLLVGSGSSGQVVKAAGLRCRLPIARNERM